MGATPGVKRAFPPSLSPGKIQSHRTRMKLCGYSGGPGGASISTSHGAPTLASLRGQGETREVGRGAGKGGRLSGQGWENPPLNQGWAVTSLRSSQEP